MIAEVAAELFKLGLHSHDLSSPTTCPGSTASSTCNSSPLSCGAGAAEAESLSESHAELPPPPLSLIMETASTLETLFYDIVHEPEQDAERAPGFPPYEHEPELRAALTLRCAGFADKVRAMILRAGGAASSFVDILWRTILRGILFCWMTADFMPPILRAYDALLRKIAEFLRVYYALWQEAAKIIDVLRHPLMVRRVQMSVDFAVATYLAPWGRDAHRTTVFDYAFWSITCLIACSTFIVCLTKLDEAGTHDGHAGQSQSVAKSLNYYYQFVCSECHCLVCHDLQACADWSNLQCFS